MSHRTAPPARRRTRTTVVCTAVTARVLTLTALLSGTPASAATDVRDATAAQLYRGGQYLSPTSEAARAAAALASSDPAGARAASVIAQYPVATWLGEWTTGPTLARTIDTATAGGASAGTTPVFVLYAIPDRDCGGYSAGGFDERTYDAWVDQVVARLAGKRAAVVVEPDSLAMLSNARCTTDLDEQRYRILSRTVTALTAAGVPAYLDAGNSNWVQPSTMAARLERAGVDRARGFSTNVANYYPVAQEQAYAERVSALTGGAHYVIDTSRSGQGWRGTWCNAPGAGLGATPRVASDGTALDALLWVKTPGASDGTCNGGPAAGRWYAAYARALVANAALDLPTSSTVLGALDDVTGSAGTVRVTGWAADRQDPARSLTVDVTVDGAPAAPVAVAGVSASGTAAVADRPRADVDRSYGVGAAHGYDVTVAAPAGLREVCVRATGTTVGQLGCEQVTVLAHGPVVSTARAVVAPGGVAVSGWAYDGDAPTTSVPVTLLVDDRPVRTAVADLTRSEPVLPGALGQRHGFEAVVPAGAGRHRVCARVDGTATGTAATSCRTVSVPAAAPSATIRVLSSPARGQARITGWAFDRDATDRPVTVSVSVDGRAPVRLEASGRRADVDRTYGVGPRHGFAGTFAAKSGKRSVCVSVQGIGAGGDRELRCRTLVVR
ncbi:glycoside hydrolase family 6 protein [Curtobacterium sp. MCSS17_008]|uniref:glycoside hydrolase family 6 protein n=1 Tax=Curtobacterium sp. MCSS17_008 TaxID=2175647 RepID=UPI0011B3CF69|nr:glycoside hydrolase family 6 protein [Curtobacterium sp. MCSS17_008]